MEIDLTTPALLFSAISLIMLAYTNRFLSYAGLVRALKEQHQKSHSSVTAAQIANLRQRLYAGNRYSKPAAVCGQHVLYLYPASSGIGLYLWPGIGAADYLAGNFGV